MDYLSLFCGAGGGDLGLQYLLGWRCVGYVDNDEFCCRVVEKRIEEGYLSRAPVYQVDVREFVEGWAGLYRGVAECVAAGFPCQPFSVAGKRKGKEDERNLWPATLAAVRVVRPRYVYLENVSGLLAHEYFGEILGSLAASGFTCRWRVLSAAELGATHRRDRFWLVADAECFDRKICLRPRPSRRRLSETRRGGSALEGGLCGWPPKEDDGPGWAKIRQSDEQPILPGMAHGLPNRMDRLGAIGQAQVPVVAATAWRLLTDA